MYDANYIHLILHQRETVMHKLTNISATMIYAPSTGWKEIIYAWLGAILISLGTRLREASHNQDMNFQAELNQECC
jgi:hypothetical protein